MKTAGKISEVAYLFLDTRIYIFFIYLFLLFRDPAQYDNKKSTFLIDKFQKTYDSSPHKFLQQHVCETKCEQDFHLLDL